MSLRGFDGRLNFNNFFLELPHFVVAELVGPNGVALSVGKVQPTEISNSEFVISLPFQHKVLILLGKTDQSDSFVGGVGFPEVETAHFLFEGKEVCFPFHIPLFVVLEFGNNPQFLSDVSKPADEASVIVYDSVRLAFLW